MSSNVGWYPFVWKKETPDNIHNFNPMTYNHGTVNVTKSNSYAIGSSDLKSQVVNPNPLDKVGNTGSYHNSLFLGYGHGIKEKQETFHVGGNKTVKDLNQIDFSNYNR